MKTYSYEEAISSSLDYFDGDQIAANVFVTKYALQNNKGEYLELTPNDMHKRLASEFARIEKNYPNSMSRREIFDLFKDFKYVIPQGSPMSGIGNNYKLQSLSNCFVIDAPADSYAGILKADQEQVQIMKRRGGVGFDISSIRPKGMITSNAAKTTDGIEVFMDRFSNSCREVAQGGRRGALMLTISVHHPQIMDFIKIKRDLTRVTGANISVRVTDNFMNSVKNDDLYTVQWPVDADIKKEKPLISNLKNAREVWHALIEGAHTSAEPGVLFWDTAKKMTPSDIYEEEGFGSTSTNPCGEIILSPYDSCRLMLVNLTSFVKNPWSGDSEFDWGHYASVVQKAQRLMDDMIDLEIEQINKILDKIDKDPESDDVKYYERTLWHNIRQAAIKGRRTGLGITGLGDALAMLGVKYGSEKSVSTTEEIYKWLSLNSYESSIILAKERGSFPIWDLDLEANHPFLDRILSNLLDNRLEDYRNYGRRNIANTTTAPAGSVSMMTQTTSGIEPVFMLHYKRRKKINPNDENATVDFVDELGDKWTEFNVFHHGFKQWLDSTDQDCEWEEDAPEIAASHSPYSGATANEINWVNKVNMQAAAQKWICHAISNTTNLPSDVCLETVKDIYMLGWELGCKGITVYRDGCRSGVLVSPGSDETSSDEFQDQHAPRRPEILECEIHQAKIKGEAWTILVGLMNGRPYEVIGGLSEYVEIPRKYRYGQIRRRARKSVPSKYDLVIGKNGDTIIIKDIITVFDNPNHSSFTRTISLALRHGAPIQYVVEQLQKDKDADLWSFSRVLARCLKKHIEDGTIGGDKDCPSCGAENSLQYQEGCVACTACGFSKCG